MKFKKFTQTTKLHKPFLNFLMMPQHEIKNCPRCNTTFECKVGSISLCQCSTITLTIEEQAFIDTKYQDCLCGNCLKDIKKNTK